MPRVIVDGQDVADAISAAGGGGASFGDGSLGDVVLSALLETSGERNYGNLTVETTGALAATALRKLTVLCTGNLEIQGTGSIHADGRGCPGTDGNAGTDAAINSNSNSALNSNPVGTADTLLLISEGGAGGGGGAGALANGPGTAGGGGNGGAGPRRFADTVTTANGNAGGAGGPVNSTGGDTPGGDGQQGPTSPVGATARARLVDEIVQGRFPGLMGGGGGGGGAGAGGADQGGGSGGVGGSAGTAGPQTGSGLGIATSGGAPTGGQASGGGGSGGGGAGGGALEVRVQNDLTISASGRISANGGSGGNGGISPDNTVRCPGGSGGGGGGGGGGVVRVLYGGVGTNVDAAHVLADGGAAGVGGPIANGLGAPFFGVNGGGAGADGRPGEDGYAVIVTV